MIRKALHKHIQLVEMLRHFFIPHHGNDHKPHFFREHSMLSILIVSMTLLLISITTYTILRTTAFGKHIVSSSIITLTNEARRDYGIPPLTRNIRLEEAAYLKARDMETRRYFAHYAPDGTAPWHWFDVTGYRFIYAGENLALNFSNSKDVETAWLQSKNHRTNILDTRYEDTGVAVLQGDIGSMPTLFIVQLFGSPEYGTRNGTLYDTAHWYELFIFNISRYIHNIYLLLISILIVALGTMIGVEIKKQHLEHIVYGILIIIVVSICLTINSFLM